MKKAYFLICLFIYNTYGMEIKLSKDNTYVNGKHLKYSFSLTLVDNNDNACKKISKKSTGNITSCVAYPIDFKNNDPFDPNVPRNTLIDQYISFLEYLKSIS